MNFFKLIFINVLSSLLTTAGIAMSTSLIGIISHFVLEIYHQILNSPPLLWSIIIAVVWALLLITLRLLFAEKLKQSKLTPFKGFLVDENKNVYCPSDKTLLTTTPLKGGLAKVICPTCKSSWELYR